MAAGLRLMTIRVDVPAMSVEDRVRVAERLQALARDCGCALGLRLMVAMGVALIAISSAYIVINGVGWLTLSGLAIGAVLFLSVRFSPESQPVSSGRQFNGAPN